jgi:hypothetical protein
MGKEKALAFQQEQGDFELVLITTDNQVIVTAGLVDCFAERGEGYTYEYLS